jgi:hypothetical protein
MGQDDTMHMGSCNTRALRPYLPRGSPRLLEVDSSIMWRKTKILKTHLTWIWTAPQCLTRTPRTTSPTSSGDRLSLISRPQNCTSRVAPSTRPWRLTGHRSPSHPCETRGMNKCSAILSRSRATPCQSLKGIILAPSQRRRGHCGILQFRRWR